MINFDADIPGKTWPFMCVRWYCAYPLNYRKIEEMMAEREIIIDHSALNRWSVHCAPKLETLGSIKIRSDPAVDCTLMRGHLVTGTKVKK